MNKDFMYKVKVILAKVWAVIKTFLIKLLSVSKKLSLKFINWLGRFYKYKIIPFSIRLKEKWNEFLRSVKPDKKQDLGNLFVSIKDTYSGVVYYGKIALDKTSAYLKKLYALLKQKLSKQKTVSATQRKQSIPFSFSFFPANVIRHIKYLSYRKLIIYSLALLTLDVFFIWFSSYRVLYAKHYWGGVEDKKFFIRPGKNLDDILSELKEKDILKSKFIFKVYVKLSGKEDKIISKGYIFKSGINNSELLNLLTDKNMIQTEKFTVIEGWRIKQIAKVTENKLQLSADKFIKETENDSLINILGLKGKVNNLEGFLFPDTYYLPLDIDERGLVNFLFNEFRKRVLNDEEVKEELKKSKFNLLQIVTLASIIQGETNLKDEMPVVSGVYLNRLKKNMRLEADPTIQYVIPDGPKARLKYSDLKIDSPYNTYRHYGLPPGPVNNPGLYAIKSVLKPDKNNYIFFVATGLGGHKFSETYQEHLKAVEEYKKNLEKKSEQ